jgi:hypothetical protein
MYDASAGLVPTRETAAHCTSKAFGVARRDGERVMTKRVMTKGGRTRQIRGDLIDDLFAVAEQSRPPNNRTGEP